MLDTQYANLVHRPGSVIANLSLKFDKVDGAGLDNLEKKSEQIKGAQVLSIDVANGELRTLKVAGEKTYNFYNLVSVQFLLLVIYL